MVYGIPHEFGEIGMQFSKPVRKVGAVDIHLTETLQARYGRLIEVTHVLVPASDHRLHFGTCGRFLHLDRRN